MKLYSFLISFAFANVSSYYNKTDYTNDVVITNAHIELAYNMNNFIIKDNVVLNGLEHIIKTIIEGRQYFLECMNSMLVVPEYLPFWFDWSVLKDYQKQMRDKIQLELNIPVPQVPEESFRGLVLEDLGVKRREFTGRALKNILNRIIKNEKPENVTNLLNERRHLGTDTLENRISRALARPEMEKSLSWMCHLIALFMSTKSPQSHIKHILINSDGSCTLRDDYPYGGSTNKTYRKIEEQWCQVFGNIVKPLKELLS